MKTTDLYIYVATGRRPNTDALDRAKRTLKARGWSYRTAAPRLGVCYNNLALVLTGRRESRRLLARIETLPHREKEAA